VSIRREENLMPIRFECGQCGEVYTVKDEYAGKPFTCRQCKTPGVVSGPETATAPAAAPTRGCPACGAELRPDAAFCVECGQRLSTRAARDTRPSAPPRGRARPGIALPLGKIVGAAVLLVVALAAWRLVIRPWRIDTRFDEAKQMAEKGETATAAEEFGAMAASLGGEDGRRAARLAAMMRLEDQRGSAPTEGVSLSWSPGAEAREMGARLLIRVSVQNDTDQELLLRRECFYLSDGQRLVFPAGKDEEPVDGVVVGPGGTGGGVLGFYRVPGARGIVTPSDLQRPGELVYNDGANYAVTAVLPAMLLMGSEATE
jgi:hypothetical protein